MLIPGGRGSSKTYEVTQALAIKGHQQPLRIGVAREHLKSIDESAKPELEERMRSLGLLRPGCYGPTRSFIDHPNGTHFFFIGLSKLSEEDIKGLAMVDILWVEEAHRMSHSSWTLLDPTIRKENAQIWATWNPKYRTDAIDKFPPGQPRRSARVASARHISGQHPVHGAQQPLAPPRQGVRSGAVCSHVGRSVRRRVGEAQGPAVRALAKVRGCLGSSPDARCLPDRRVRRRRHGDGSQCACDPERAESRDP